MHHFKPLPHPSMASTLLKSLLLFLALSTSSSLPLNSSSSLESHHLSSIKSVCKSTPYPDACFDSLKLSLSTNFAPYFLNFFLQSLRTALTLAGELSNLFSDANLVEKQRGTIQNCIELHQITLLSMQKILEDSKNLANARVFLSAALTNKITCLDSLDSASGPMKQFLVNQLLTTYMHVSNSLSMLTRTGWQSGGVGGNRRRLLSYPRWLSRKARRVLQISGEDYDPSEVLTVAADGSGNFTTISDAINFAPNNSVYRTFIYVREGVYREYVHIPSWKTNIVLIGDGSDVTVITGNRSFDGGWTTYSTATVAITGEGFLARDITFENTAGPENHQAVALLVNADLTALYRCTVVGYQDTLYIHAFRQFYRECNIYGTIDYISGNAIAAFQGCNIVSRMPMHGQYIVITAQSRAGQDQDTGIVIQNCTIIPTEELYNNSRIVKSYLGRPWRNYSRTVYMESYIGDFIAPEGWINWNGDVDEGPETLYYGEYWNYGPGSSTDNRVSWPGYHVMDYFEASNFTVSSFIGGEMWLDSTSIPYYDGV